MASELTLPEASDPASARLALRATGLTFRRGDKTIVAGIDLELRHGERTAILGPSGAGKTTLLRLLAGLERPDEGSVEVRSAQGRRAARVGLLFQDLALFPHMRVWTNVAFPLQARGVGKAERRRVALDALRRAGLEGKASRLPKELSGGERQRVALLRTLLSEPAVVLLDEPFASLDPHLVTHFAGWLSELQRESGVPMVIVTHDVDFALAWADQVVVMREGVVEQSGEAAALFERPATAFVAAFLGECSLLPATVVSRIPGGSLECRLEGAPVTVRAEPGSPEAARAARVTLSVRPHALDLSVPGTGATGTVAGRVEEIDFAGPVSRYRVALDGGARVSVHVGHGGDRPGIGADVEVRFPEAGLVAVSG